MSAKKLHYVEERLEYLHTLKAPLILKYREWLDRYKGGENYTKKNPYQSNYTSNLTFSIIQAKLAEILTGVQEYDFIPLSNEAYKSLQSIKNIWKYEWLKTNTDRILYLTFQSGLTGGDGYMYEGMRRIVRDVNIPYTEGGKTKYKKERITDYEGIYSEYIPWENLYHDGRTISEANEAIWIKNWDRQEYINSFGNNPDYKNVDDTLPIGRYYYNGDKGDLILAPVINDENIVTELVYYNKSKDEHIKIVNGIEVYSGHIPYSHKEIPILQYIDYYIEDRMCNMGEYELLDKDVEYKDAIRGLYIDLMKAQVGFTAIDPEADFDEATIEIGVNNFTRVDPTLIKHFAPNITTQGALQAEQKVDEDIIIKSGIDFKSQILGPGETATKTAAKTQSARKRINLNLKLNSYNFFERLARLRMANIQSYYGEGIKEIPVKGYSISEDGVATPCKGFGIYTIKPDHIKGKFNVVPITDSILGASSEREKARILEFSQIAPSFVGQDGKPFVNMEKLFEQIVNKLGLDYEELSSSSTASKNPEDIMKELKLGERGVEVGGFEDPNYIPPEQRSGAKNAKIGGINSLPIE